MAVSRQGGAGIPVDLQPLIPYNASTRYDYSKTNVNEFQLGSGETFLVPSGQWFVTPGPYSFIQTKDPITGLWRNLPQTPNVSRYVSSDGANFRVANLTGCAIGAHVTTVGSGYTSAPAVAASSGSSAWTAIVGGAINSTVTVTAGGAGYAHKPILLIAPPPAGGVQATAVAVVSAGAIASVTVLDQGAGYTSAPAIYVLPDPRDTITTEAQLTVNATLTGSGVVTAVVCTDHGTPLTAVPTLSFSGGGGSSAAATAVMCFTTTGFTITNAGVAYGASVPVLIDVADGRITTAAGTVVNPSIGVGLLNPRNGSAIVLSEAGGTISATPTIQDGGLFAKVPTAFFMGSASTPATTTAVATVTVGGVNDVLFIQPA